MSAHPYSSALLMLPLAVTAAMHSQAQTTSTDAAFALEEVVVTARKREQSLQDVSLSVMALSESMIRDAFLTDTEELTQLVPSLNLQQGGRQRASSFNIRGVGTQSYSEGVEPSVSTVLDGVVMGRSGMAFMRLLDVERVEILRGPQGTLFGKNSTAGVVHIITQEPTEEFSGSVTGTIIEDDEWYTGFTLSGPAGETLGYRLSGTYAEDDGFVDNVYTGEIMNSKDEWSLRGKLRWYPSETLSVLWTSDANDRDGNCCVSPIISFEPYPEQPPNNQGTVDAALDRLSPAVPGEFNTDVALDFPDWAKNKGQGHSLTVDWELGDHTLTSITAYRDWNQQQSADTDMQPEYYLQVHQRGETDQDQWTQELRLTSPSDRTLSYVLGLYYFDQQIGRDFERYIFDGWANSVFSVDTTNYAAFGEATWNISDDWRLVLGGRFTRDELEFEFQRSSDSAFQPEIPYFTDDAEEDDFSGKLTLEWNPTEDMLTYATYVQGYKGPAFNITSGSTPENTSAVDPERSESFEIGVKSTWLDNRLVVNAALFHTEYTDFQVDSTESRPLLDEDGNPVDNDDNGVPDTSFSYLLTNVGEVTSKGLEVDVIAQLTANLSLFGGVAFIDATIDEYPGGPCSFGQEFRGIGYRGQTSCADDAARQDLAGGEMPFSPDWKLNIGVSYLTPLQSMPFDIDWRANFRAQDDILFAIDQDVNLRQEAYEILDLSITLRDKEDRYTASLLIKNALDENFYAAIAAQNENLLPNAYVSYLSRNYERRVGVELRYNW